MAAFTVGAATLHQLFVELLQVVGGQLRELDAADVGGWCTARSSDERKAGGAHLTVTGVVKKVDDYKRLISMRGGMVIPMDDVLTIEGELFSELE